MIPGVANTRINYGEVYVQNVVTEEYLNQEHQKEVDRLAALPENTIATAPFLDEVVLRLGLV